MSTLRFNTWQNTGGTEVANSTLGTGKILQVVQAVKTDRFTTTSTTMVDVTGVSVSITPSSASSKVFILVTGVGGNTGSTSHTLLNIVRDSTAIAQATSGSENYTSDIYNNSAGAGTGFALSYLDSPSTTSATTYKLQAAASAGTAVVGGYAAGSFYGVTTMITVMEVSA